jgi:hypothetical protein
MLFRRTLWTTFAASIVIACSGGSGGGGGASTPSSFSQQICQLYASNCCVKAGKSSDPAQCTAFYDAFTKNQQYNGAQGQACIDALNAKASTPEFCANGLDEPACQGVFTAPGSAGGTRQPGDTCTEDSDCAPATEGKVECETHFDNKGGETRTCQVQIPGKEGDTPCLGTKDGNLTSFSSSGDQTTPPRGFICDVASGVYCDSTSHACKKIGDVGADCSNGGQYACVKAAYCDFTSHTCVARIPVGGDCGSSTSSSSCADKSYCDQTTKKCTAGLPEGSPCESSQQCESGTCVNKACGKSSSGDFSTALLCSG